jgi:ribonucleoside-diphosphate reductase alpha chain
MGSILIKKRNGVNQRFAETKIKSAIERAAKTVSIAMNKEDIKIITKEIKLEAENKNQNSDFLTVEQIQDLVERKLVELNYHDVLKSFIIYRDNRTHVRELLDKFSLLIKDYELIEMLKVIERQYDQDKYNIKNLYSRLISYCLKGMSQREILDNLIKSALELTSKDCPKWEYIASKFLCYRLYKNIEKTNSHLDKNSFFEKLKFYTNEKLYGSYILEKYTEEEVNDLDEYLKHERNDLLNYSSLNILIKRYLIRNHDNKPVENPQEMFMGISMHLAMNEGENKVYWAKRFYDMLSRLKVTMATPTMSNSRKPHHQLSSCFIDTVADSLNGIYKSMDNFAQVSKLGGGMGMYFGKVRANGSDIRGFKGVAGGVIRWIRLANDTSIAVDQLGVRQGSVAVYLDAWHKDLPEFLQLKTNNGDDRMKAHDVFPAVCYPDLFWKMVKGDMNKLWYLMCPHEIKTVTGYSLEDYYGEEWENKYYACVNDPRIHKRSITIKDMVRLIIKSATETGTPFVFNRDHVNRANPNKHKGVIYSSNLCTEIAQNMSEITDIQRELIMDKDGKDIVIETSTAGDFVVCNLASLVLGNINVADQNEMEEVISTVIRALDNVIDLNYYPVAYAERTNKKYRALGLGTSGLHHLLSKNGIDWESEEHIKFVDKVYEDINYYAIKASMEISKEKGSYTYFEGSDWDNGDYFELRNYNDNRWQELKSNVNENGMRNGYLIAVAPTVSTSIIACTTASTDPIMNKYFLEEKRGDIVPRVAPDLNEETFHLYKSAHDIDQNWSIRSTGVRQRHCDQAQSFNLYITTDFTMRQILDLYINAWENGVKTIYYVRGKSLEVEECESCSA